MNEYYKEDAITKRLNDISELNVKETLEQAKASENLKKVAKNMKKIHDDKIVEQFSNQADDVMEAATGSVFWKWFGAGMAVVGFVMAGISAWSAIKDLEEYYHQEMLNIPKKMVDAVYQEDGTSAYVYYDCTPCNRTQMNMGNETLGDCGDMNGDVMKEWLALYTTKDIQAGNPIRAGFKVQKGNTSIPMGKKPLSFFGFDYAVNMTDEKYVYNDSVSGIYLYYTQDNTPYYSGTVETANAFVTVGLLSAMGGAGICALAMSLIGKKKKEEATA